MKAATISAYSHLLTAWQLAELNETIPYEAALVDTMDPSEARIARGQALDPIAKRFLARARA